MFSLAVCFVGVVCTTFGKGLATLQVFDNIRSDLLTDYSKTAMCWSHHSPDSPDDEKGAVFCSCYTLVPPWFYFHHYSITVSFFPLKTDILFFYLFFFYFKHSFTTVRTRETITDSQNVHMHYMTLNTLVLFNT